MEIVLNMKIYQIKGLPIGWAIAPCLVTTWIKQLRIKGQKIGNKIVFKIETIREGLKALRVPHVAVFIDEQVKDKTTLEFNETDCEENE